MATALRYEGFEVATAQPARRRSTSSPVDPPDLVVLDVMLPDLDGFEVARRIRQDGDRVPIVFLTARTPPRTRSGVSRLAATTT